MVEPNLPGLSVVKQTELLAINRTSLYYHPRLPSPAKLARRDEVLQEYLQRPYNGSRVIAKRLSRKEDHPPVNRKAVQADMRKLSIRGICPKRNLSRKQHQASIFPYLLRNIRASRPNHVWALDITYIRVGRSYVYLVAIIDLHSRFIVGWELSLTLETGFVLSALRKAFATYGTPQIINSDQGGQFTSSDYVKLLKKAEIQISMDGVNRALDNVYIERFWRTVKWEKLYLEELETPRDVRKALNSYMEDYNYDRPHQSLKYQTPSEVYRIVSSSTNIASG
jgi:putative transposase